VTAARHYLIACAVRILSLSRASLPLFATTSSVENKWRACNFARPAASRQFS
jgi:hypothetical protein